MDRAGRAPRQKCGSVARVTDPFPPPTSAQRAISPPGGDFFKRIQRIHQDEEENPILGFRPQLNPNRL
jgi:hypothetical protein